MIMNMVGSSEVKPQYSVYGFRIAVDEPDPSTRVTYPKNIFGQLNGASLIETPAYGTGENCLNDWADCPLITGIKRQTGNAVKGWTDVSDKRSAVAGSSTDMVMTFVPTWFMKMTSDGTNIDCAFSKTQIDSTWKDYAGSVGSERIGHFRLGCYVCKSDFKSYSGQPKDATSIADFIAGCQKLGTGYDIMTWYQWTYLAALAVLLYRSTDLQAAMASGYVSGSSVQSETALTFTNDYGLAGTPGNTGTTQMAFFWIQNLWGNITQFVGGAKTNSSCRLMTQTSYSSVTESEFTKVTPEVGVSLGGGYITTVAGTTDAGFFPTEASGSGTTYFADEGSVDSSVFPFVGGRYNAGNVAGPFNAYFSLMAFTAYSDVGSRLSYRL